MSKRVSNALGGALSKVDDIAKYTDDIINAAAKGGSSFFKPSRQMIKTSLQSLNDDFIITILKNVDDPGIQATLLRAMRSSPDLDADALKRLDEIDGGVGGVKNLDATDDAASASEVVKTGDELAEMTYLANRTAKLSGDEATKVNRYFSGLSESALDVEADTLVKNWSTTGRKAFDNLPAKSQETLLKNSQSLRYQAKRSSGLADKLKGACKSAPVYCDIGKGLGGLGAAVGVGFALEAVYDQVMKELNNDDNIAACIATCYPDDWYSSTASGSGSIDYKNLTGFKTIEGLKESTGNDDITTANTPLCNKDQTGEQCATMCNQRCEDLNKTFFQKVTSAAGGAAKDLVNEAADVAGTGLKGFLDGIFGEGMGIPAAIGIVVAIIILIVLMSTM